ncbi:MAG TPA: amidohydrolase family protein [Candidatus Binataceae bacterium]|jgi:predicted TIM-barrel fold metal-dependent hydrolase|nr:amidohydrolase family protein [Candidatus Binataceae bacterium]
MPYAEGRVYNDADAHIMEQVDWVASYADAKTRQLLKPLDVSNAGKMNEHGTAFSGKFPASHWDEINIEKNLMFIKGWGALGAFDPDERKRAMDLLGFNRQLVFTSLAMSQFWGVFAQREHDLDLLYGGAAAVNRAISDFCRNDSRLIAVGFLPLDDPKRAERAFDEGLKAGCGTFWIPAAPAGDKSPSHHDFDGVWARFQDANVPFMLHVGAGETPMPDAYRNNGRGPIKDFLGGEGEVLDSKGFMMLHGPAEAFLSALVLDGTLEQFPRLRGGVIELGALWVPPWLRRLDIAQQAFAKGEPALALPMKASDYVRRQLKFTPHPTEPVGWIIEQGGEELFLFSSDYPHIEGGRNPIKRFEESLAGVSETAKERFYATNFAEMMG